MTKKHFAVLGDPIGHSLSPRIHTAAYEHLDLEWDYAKLQVAKGELETFLRESSSEYSGFSVTMPLKVEAAALAEAGDQIVEVLGVANTLARSESSWIGYNTDVFGIQRALANAWSENLARVAILGSGATAQSALYALSLSAPESSVDVYVRDALGAQQISDLAKLLGMNLAVHNLSEFGKAQNLTISTVPAEALEQFATQSQQGWLLNVNYASSSDAFSASFEAHRVVDGEVMLIWQAIAQIRIFLNGDVSVPLDDEASLYVKMLEAL